MNFSDICEKGTAPNRELSNSKSKFVQNFGKLCDKAYQQISTQEKQKTHQNENQIMFSMMRKKNDMIKLLYSKNK